jgi:hypothetical protein
MMTMLWARCGKIKRPGKARGQAEPFRGQGDKRQRCEQPDHGRQNGNGPAPQRNLKPVSLQSAPNAARGTPHDTVFIDKKTNPCHQIV